MILEFRVENFLSFREEQILSFEATAEKGFESEYCVDINKNLKILKLGFIYGANASGKTNLIKALHFLNAFILHQKNGKNEPTGCDPFIFDDSCIDKPSRFYLSFFINKTKFIYNVELDEKIVYYENLSFFPSSKSALIYERTYDRNKDKTIIKFGNYSKLKLKDRRTIEGLTISNSSVLSSFGKANVEKSIITDIYNWFIDGFAIPIYPNSDLFGWAQSKIKNNKNRLEFLLDVLKKADFNISSIDITTKKIDIDSTIEKNINSMNIPDELKQKIINDKMVEAEEIRFQHSTKMMKKYLPISAESKGTLRFFGMGAVLESLIKDGSIYAIDELENSLHYELVAHFIKIFLENSNSSQLIFTTHDINLLNLDFLRRDTVWFVEKNEYGASELYSLVEFKLHKNLSPFNAYRVGKLGAKPNLSDSSINNYE